MEKRDRREERKKKKKESSRTELGLVSEAVT